MYTRVKRERRHVKRDMYGIPINDDDKDKTASSGNSDTESEWSFFLQDTDTLFTFVQFMIINNLIIVYE